MNSSRKIEEGNMKKAVRLAAFVSLFITSIFCVYMFYMIALLPSYTGASIWVMFLPVYALFFFAFSFAFVWSVAILHSVYRRIREFGKLGLRKVLGAPLAITIFLITSSLAAIHFYSFYLERRAMSNLSISELRGLYERRWSQKDPNVLKAIARNKNTPSDILRELYKRTLIEKPRLYFGYRNLASGDFREIKTIVKENPNAPPDLIPKRRQMDFSSPSR